MYQVTFDMIGVSPLSWTRHHYEPKKDRESADDYEKRTWKHKVHVNRAGQVVIPPMALKNCLRNAAEFLSMQIPGKGKSTFTKHFKAGTIVDREINLSIPVDSIDGQWLFVPASGKSMDGKRVMKCFPIIQGWRGSATVYVLDETITKEVFLKHLQSAGQFIGIGCFRPINGGLYGRFNVENVKYSEMKV